MLICPQSGHRGDRRTPGESGYDWLRLFLIRFLRLLGHLFSHFGPFLSMFSRIFVPSRVLNRCLFDFGSMFGGSGRVLRGFWEGFFNDLLY